jgi:DNA-binding FadR family transcriptional regulator
MANGSLILRKQRGNMAVGKRKLSDRVYEYILGQVLSGAFGVNSRLPAEQDLALRLDVSRPVVREALQRLREDGLIMSRQGSGSVVVQRPDRSISGFAPIGSIADIQRCFVFRQAVEGEAAALAARHHDGRAIERLRKALAALEQASAEHRVGAEEDFAFHLCVAEASGNHFFTSTLAAIREQIAGGINVNRNLSLIQSRARRATVQREHEAIFETIRAADAEGARRAMRDHIEKARLRLFEGG